MKLAALAVTIALAIVPQDRGAPATIDGYVLESGTGRPVAGAEVRADGVRLPSKTEADGYFRLQNVSPGRREIEVTKEGYFARLDRGDTHQVTVRAGEVLRDIVVRLHGTGTVKGRVLDSDGRPAVSAAVRVFRYKYSEFRREPSGIELVGRRDTDDRGEFRLFSVPAGQYFLAAITERGAVLYPRERELRRATPVEVLSQQETNIGDLVLVPRPRGQIRAHTINATGASVPGNIDIAVLPQGWDSPDDSFFGGFSPSFLGFYELHTAFQTRGAGNVAGLTVVEYGGADIDVDVVLSKLEGQIGGRVLLENPDGSTKPLPGAEMEFFRRTAESAFSDNDGRFAVKGLLNGPFEFSGSFEIPENYYVASMRDRDRDVLRTGVMVTETPAELEVRIKSDGGKLQGKVVDGRERVVSYAVVVLVPQSLLGDRTDRHDTYRLGRSTETGAFSLDTIIPGDYLLYAWSDMPDGAVMDPFFMEKYRGRGLPVRVESSGRLKMDVRILDE